MNSTIQAVFMFLAILCANLVTAWSGTGPDGQAITQFSDVSPVQYGIAVGSAIAGFPGQRSTARRDAVK